MGTCYTEPFPLDDTAPALGQHDTAIMPYVMLHPMARPRSHLGIQRFGGMDRPVIRDMDVCYEST